MALHRKFLSDKEIVGSAGVALESLPKVTLRSWGFSGEGTVTTWRDHQKGGMWIEGEALPAASDTTAD